MPECPPSGQKIFFQYSTLHNLRRDMDSVHIFNANFSAYQLFRMKEIECSSLPIHSNGYNRSGQHIRVGSFSE